MNQGDIQRAVQDGLRHIQNDMQKLSNSMQQAHQQIQYTDETMRMVQDMQRMLHQFQPWFEDIHRRVSDSGSNQRIDTIQRDIQELKTRFAAVERFATQMSEYIRQIHESDREDREYRNG